MDTPGYDIRDHGRHGGSGIGDTLHHRPRHSCGFPAVVIKISSNSALFAAMADDIDIDAGTVLVGKSAAEVGEEILALLLRVANGEKTKAEANNQAVFAFAQEGPAF
jgi:altronate hydrolase